MVIELKYGNTNTYLIKGKGKYVLFDTDWAGTFELFCREIKRNGIGINDIAYLFVSHFHPDHMGIAGQLAEMGIQIVVLDLQKDYIHFSDAIFAKENGTKYVPIDDAGVVWLTIESSRSFLEEIGVHGEILATPGHSDDSISLWLDDGSLLVGDLNPLYELPLHEGTPIAETWNSLLKRNPTTVYYGHAKTYTSV